MGAFEAVREAIAEPADAATRLHRLHRSFDAFRTRELLDGLRDAGFVALPFREALAEAPFTGLSGFAEDGLETLRRLLAEEEKKLALVAAGVPAVELDQA